MQVQQERQHAPALARAGKIGEVERMQYDALNARNAKKGKNWGQSHRFLLRLASLTGGKSNPL